MRRRVLREPVRIEVAQPVHDLVRMVPTEARVREGEQYEQRDGPGQRPALPPVVAGVGGEKQQAGRRNDRLKGVVGVEREGGKQRREKDGPRAAGAVPQIEIEEPDVERRRQHQLERDAGVQKPAGEGRKQGHDDPPEPKPEEVAHQEAERNHRREEHRHLGRARDEHGSPEEDVGNDLNVHPDAQVARVAVEKVSRQELSGLVPEPVVHEPRGLHGLDGLVAEEINREALEPDQARREKHGQRKGEEDERLAGVPGLAGGRRCRLWHGLRRAGASECGCGRRRPSGL